MLEIGFLDRNDLEEAKEVGDCGKRSDPAERLLGNIVSGSDGVACQEPIGVTQLDLRQEACRIMTLRLAPQDEIEDDVDVDQEFHAPYFSSR